jgi:hypothetical protein
LWVVSKFFKKATELTTMVKRGNWNPTEKLFADHLPFIHLFIHPSIHSSFRVGAGSKNSK